MSDFRKRRVQQELEKMSVPELHQAVNQGLEYLKKLVINKPKDWDQELESIENTLKVLKTEIEARYH